MVLLQKLRHNLATTRNCTKIQTPTAWTKHKVPRAHLRFSLSTITMCEPPSHHHDIFRRLPYELRIEVARYLVAWKDYKSVWSLLKTTRSWWDVLAPTLLASRGATLDESLLDPMELSANIEQLKHARRLTWRAETPWDMRAYAMMWRLLDEPKPRPLPPPFELLFMDRRKLVKLQPYTSGGHNGTPEGCLLPCKLCEQEKEHPEWLPYAYPSNFYYPDAFSATLDSFIEIGLYADEPEDWIMMNGPTGEGQIPGIESWADCEREIVASIEQMPNLETFEWDFQVALPSQPIVDALVVRKPKSLRMFHAPRISSRSDVTEALPLLSGVECLSLEFFEVEGDEDLLKDTALQLFDALCTSGKVKHLQLKIRSVDDRGCAAFISLAARLHSVGGYVAPRRETEAEKRKWTLIHENYVEIQKSLCALRPLLRQSWLGKDGSGDLTADDVLEVFKTHDVLHPLGHLADIDADAALAQKTADVWNAQTDKGPNEPGWPKGEVFTLSSDLRWYDFPPFAAET